MMDSRLHIRTISSYEELQGLATPWNELLQSSCSDTLFLTWEWVSIWWNVYGADSRLLVMTAHADDGRLVGIAPLRRVRRSVLGLWTFDMVSFIGSGTDVTPEYLDFIIERGREAQVTQAFVNELCADPSVSVIDLHPFATHSPNLDTIVRSFEQRPGQLSRTPDGQCPVFALPESTEKFMAGRSRNYRKKIGEYERRCTRLLKARVRMSATPAEVRDDMVNLAALHHKRWNSESRSFQSQQYLEFHHKLAQVLFQRGWLRLFSLDANCEPLAALYCFCYGGRYLFYQSGRDPKYTRERVGLVLMHRAIQQAIRDGAKVFDFLRGGEDYKYRWADSDLRSDRLVYSSSLSARAVSAVLRRLNIL